MIHIPAGEFILGSDRGEDYEGPQRVVCLGDYWIDQFPVTNQEFAKFVFDSKYRPTGTWDPQSVRSKGTHPVTGITWRDAHEYGAWCNKRLPTEYEWEKAGRGTQGPRFPWGNQWNAANCCCWEGGARSTCSVGAHQADKSPFGVVDMAGNVSEWCSNDFEFDRYALIEATNPSVTSDSQVRAVRGGNWLEVDRSSFELFRRGMMNTAASNGCVGFRCCRDTPPK
ncbi:hypothetical protein YTPLAS18_40540 [Nitrospira sp.]|nr:hypothetical protein YTPLAS18_40540 [Nitrospira sp.]